MTKVPRGVGRSHNDYLPSLTIAQLGVIAGVFTGAGDLASGILQSTTKPVADVRRSIAHTMTALQFPLHILTAALALTIYAGQRVACIFPLKAVDA